MFLGLVFRKFAKNRKMCQYGVSTIYVCIKTGYTQGIPVCHGWALGYPVQPESENFQAVKKFPFFPVQPENMRAVPDGYSGYLAGVEPGAHRLNKGRSKGRYYNYFQINILTQQININTVCYNYFSVQEALERNRDKLFNSNIFGYIAYNIVSRPFYDALQISII